MLISPARFTPATVTPSAGITSTAVGTSTTLPERVLWPGGTVRIEVRNNGLLLRRRCARLARRLRGTTANGRPSSSLKCITYHPVCQTMVDDHP